MDMPEEAVQTESPVQEDPAPEQPAAQPTMRGSLAASVGKPASVTQELMTPPNKRTGVTRI
jgi:hypothetical protein